MNKFCKYFFLFAFLVLGFTLKSSFAFAADRFWVGGSGTWDAVTTTHWSASSGGAGGASAPTAADNCIFNSASNATAYTVTLGATNINCNDLLFSNPASGVIQFTNIANPLIHGNLVLAPGMGRLMPTRAFTFIGLGTETITTNGLPVSLAFNGAGSTFQLLDDLTINGSLSLSAGTFDQNGKTITLTPPSTASILIVTGNFIFNNLTIIGAATTFSEVIFQNDVSVTGTLTLSGNSIVNRLTVSGPAGSSSTITAGAVSASNVNFQNINGAGTANWDLHAISGLSGDAGGNSAIILTVPATQTWQGISGGNWSDVSKWTSRVPLPQDNVIINAAFSSSQTITADVFTMGSTVDFTGVGGNPVLVMTTASTYNIYGSLIFGVMTLSGVPSITFGGRGNYVMATNGAKTFSSITIDNFTGKLTFQDDLTLSLLVLNSGTLDTNGKTINITSTSVGFSAISALPKTLILGASTITCSSWDVANLTLIPDSSTINVNYGIAISKLNFGGLTYNNVVITMNSPNNASFSFSGVNTFANLTLEGNLINSAILISNKQTVTGTLTINGNSPVNRLLVQSNVLGAQRILFAANVSATNADFMDIKGAGSSTWNLPVLNARSFYGDCGGNSGITFTPAANMYWRSEVSSKWSTVGNWFLDTNGTGGAGRIPLPQDTGIFDANSNPNTGVTITQDMPRIGSVDFSAVTNTPTLVTSVNASVFGSITLGTILLPSNTAAYTFAGRGFNTLKSNGLSWGTRLINLAAMGGTLQLQDDFSNGNGNTTQLAISSGTFDANNYNVTTDYVTVSCCSLKMGSGIWTLRAQIAGWSVSSNTLLKIDPGSSTIKIAPSTGRPHPFTGGGFRYNNIWLTGVSGQTLAIVGSSTFNDFIVDTMPQTLNFTAGTNTTVNTFTLAGNDATHLLTIKSAVAGQPYTLTKAGGGFISGDYLSISDSTASPTNTWFAGTHSTDGGGNSGWTFTAPPAALYWVGGTATWDGYVSSLAGYKWATSSGGAGGAAVPTSADNVIFDANSGSGTITLSANSVARSLTVNGFTGTIFHPAGVTLTLGDSQGGLGSYSLIFPSTGMTYTLGNPVTSAISFVTTTTTPQIVNFGGLTTGNVSFNGSGATWQLSGTLNVGSGATLALTNGTLDASTTSATLNVLGNLSIASGTTFLADNAFPLTISGNFTDNGTFTHNNGMVVYTPLTTSTISGPTTFYDFTASAPGKILQFKAGDIMTFAGTFTVAGGSGNFITIQSNSPGSEWLPHFNLPQTAVSYAYIKDSGCDSGSSNVILTGTAFNSGNNNYSCWVFLVPAGGGGGGGGISTPPIEGGSGGGTPVTGGDQGGGGSNTPPADGGGGSGPSVGGGGGGGGGGAAP